MDVDDALMTMAADKMAELHAECARQQNEIRRLESIARVAQEIAAWGSPVPAHVMLRLRAALGSDKLLPYPFCRQPAKCAGTGRCQAEYVCND